MHTYGLVLPATGNPSLQFQIGEYQTTYFSQIDDAQEPCQQYLIDTPLYENVSIDTTVLRAGAQDYLFKPISVQFTYPQSLCDFLTLSQDEQYRKVRLTSGSLDIQGFITEAKNKPEDSAGGTTTFTLLVSAQDALAGGAFDSGYDTGYD
jgi:response regulator of citrate/malate metabolism